MNNTQLQVIHLVVIEHPFYHNNLKRLLLILNYQILNEVLSILKYDFNSYENLGDLEKPYHRPAMNLSFTNSITFKDKIIVSPDLFYISG